MSSSPKLPNSGNTAMVNLAVLSKIIQEVERKICQATMSAARQIDQLNNLVDRIASNACDDESDVGLFAALCTFSKEDFNELAERIEKDKTIIGELLVHATASQTDKQREFDKLETEENECLRVYRETKEEFQTAEWELKTARRMLNREQEKFDDAKTTNSDCKVPAIAGIASAAVGAPVGILGGVACVIFPPLTIVGLIGVVAGGAGMVGGSAVAAIKGSQITFSEEMKQLETDVEDAKGFKNRKQEKFDKSEKELEDRSQLLKKKEKEVEECKKQVAVMKELLKKLDIYREHVVGMKNLMNQVEPEVNRLRRNLLHYKELLEAGIRQLRSKQLVKSSVESLQKELNHPDPTMAFLGMIGCLPLPQEHVLCLIMHDVHLRAIN